MGNFRLFHGIDGFSVEVVYVVGTSTVFMNEGLSGLYSCLLGVQVGLGIGGGGVGCGRHDGHCR